MHLFEVCDEPLLAFSVLSELSCMAGWCLIYRKLA